MHAVYEGLKFEQATPAPRFVPMHYEVLRPAERDGWWWCRSSLGGERRIPERAILNPRVYRVRR